VFSHLVIYSTFKYVLELSAMH